MAACRRQQSVLDDSEPVSGNDAVSVPPHSRANHRSSRKCWMISYTPATSAGVVQ